MNIHIRTRIKLLLALTVSCTFFLWLLPLDAEAQGGSIHIVKEATPEDGTDFSFTAGGPGFLLTNPPIFDITKWGSFGSGDGRFFEPRSVAVDGSGNVYVADTGNHRIQRFDAAGMFVTKWGSSGSGDGQFSSPSGVTVDGSGNVYVADTGNDRIQRFDANGTLLDMWGWGVEDGSAAFQSCSSGCQAGLAGSGDGQFSGPFGVDVDSSGNVYVVDSGNSRIQVFDAAATFVTKWGSQGVGNGQFIFPSDVAVAGSGTVYVADSSNNRIQAFDGSGTFVTNWGSNGSGDGQFFSPSGVGVDGSGHVYVADKAVPRYSLSDLPGSCTHEGLSAGELPGRYRVQSFIWIGLTATTAFRSLTLRAYS